LSPPERGRHPSEWSTARGIGGAHLTRLTVKGADDPQEILAAGSCGSGTTGARSPGRSSRDSGRHRCGRWPLAILLPDAERRRAAAQETGHQNWTSLMRFQRNMPNPELQQPAGHVVPRPIAHRCPVLGCCQVTLSWLVTFTRAYSRTASDPPATRGKWVVSENTLRSATV